MRYYLWHRFILAVLRFIVGPFVRLALGYSCKLQKGPDSPSLVISNHNTNLDPALVAMGFSRHMYFVTSEHALRGGFQSKLLKFIFAPIPINKARNDMSSIKEMLNRIKAGASVCLFAEGDRSFYGATSPISISTAKLAKTCGAELITFRIEGGYLTSPRWAKKMRRGKMSGRIVNKYSAAELKSMTNEQVLSVIERDIYENAYDRQIVSHSRYHGDNLAEHIETALFLCPGCKKIGTIRSKGDRFSCSCGLEAIYTETGLLEGETLPFSAITEWGKWQDEQLEEIVRNAGDGQICADESQQLFEIRAAVKKTLVGEGLMRIDRESFQCAGLTIPLCQITRFVVVGQMTLIFAIKDGTTYEVQSVVPRSALKYREIFRILCGNT